jgi:hypothetical protein
MTLAPALDAGGETATVGLLGSLATEGEVRFLNLGARRPGGSAGLKERLDDAARVLDDSGLLYLEVPAGRRAASARRLRARGLRVSAPLLSLRRNGETRALLMLTAGSVRLASEAVPPRASWATAAMRLGGRSQVARTVLAELWPSVGLVVRHPTTAPPFAWLAELAGLAPERVHVWALQGWRGAGDSQLLHFCDASAPTRGLVAKLGRVLQSGSREAERLAELGPTAQAAGAGVPELIASSEHRGRSVAVMTRCDGTPAVALLQRRPGQLVPMVERIERWLGQWNAMTARTSPLTSAEAERWLVRPAQRIADGLVDADRYLAYLRKVSTRATGEATVRVAAHGDLTLHNVLLSEDRMSVVDWEASTAEGLPLADLEYALVDAVHAARGGARRADAWSACFAPGGEHAGWAGSMRVRTAHALGLAPAVVEFCHHACWLHHAANEAATAGGGGRPFLEVARRVAARALEACDV